MRYRLPDALGGGECVYHADGIDNDRIVVELVDTVPGLRLELELSVLTEVKPPLPPEPPQLVTVRVGARAFVRDDLVLSRASWVGPDGRHTWSELCDLAQQKTGFPPVLLVPVPEPVELPWSTPFLLGATGVRVFIGDSSIRVEVLGKHIGITTAEAREMARALWTAADAAENGGAP